MSIGDNKYLSVAQAAALYCVKPETVLRWAKAGKIPAELMSNRRYRIPRDGLLDSIAETNTAENNEHDALETGFFQYCWEFNSKSGMIAEGCRECIVYRSRSRRCYEIANFPEEVGHSRQFCKGSCEDCDYYRKVQNQHPNLLAVARKSSVKTSLKKAAVEAGFNFKVTDCEYRCCMLVDRYRPDYAIIDASLGPEKSQDFAELLLADPRIPFIKIILIGEPDDLPHECNKMIFAFIERRFTQAQLRGLIMGLRK